MAHFDGSEEAAIEGAAADDLPAWVALVKLEGPRLTDRRHSRSDVLGTQVWLEARKVGKVELFRDRAPRRHRCGCSAGQRGRKVSRRLRQEERRFEP